MTSRDFYPYPPDARPQISVRIGDVWLDGQLRSWIRRNGTWWAHIDYTAPTGRLITATVPGDRIRSAEPAATPPTSATTCEMGRPAALHVGQLLHH